MRTLAVSLVVLELAAALALANQALPNSPENSAPSSKSVKLAKCAACSLLVESFNEAMASTANGKLGGGDTDWEENNQKGGYRRSEVRLTEIQEDLLCHNIERSQDQCLDNAGHWAEHIEDWWAAYWKAHDSASEIALPSMREWLCVERLKLCCPFDHFGPNCLPCHGRPSDDLDGKHLLCSGRGQCRGNGTRVGDGHCRCQPGYVGQFCRDCDDGHYESYKDESKVQCSACHKACQQSCTGPGPQACLVCRPGYVMDKDHGCLDVDECIIRRGGKASAGVCGEKKFCVNTEGSYRCLSCDKACKAGCDGDGPDACFDCADGFHRAKPHESDQTGFRTPCVSAKASKSPFDLDPIVVSRTRFITYSGLGVATIIIFMQRSTALASVLTALIAIYVGFAEYYLAVHTTDNDDFEHH